MPSRYGLLIGVVLGLASSARADITVDVSKEWNAHASSSPAAASIAVAGHNATPIPQTSSDTVACECDSLTVQERLEQATYAFTGTVWEAGAPKKGKRTIVFDVDEIFKGSPSLEMKVMEDVTGTDCDLPYTRGESYLVYAQWQWGNVMTSRCMGTKALAKAKSDSAMLGPSESLKEKLYTHLHNACLGRLDTACCLQSLQAMRVGYFVPEPESGCPEGTVPDRLRCGGSYTWCISTTEKGHH